MTTSTLSGPRHDGRPAEQDSASTLTGTRALAKLASRRDRIMLVAWIYVLTALIAGTAYSFRKLFPTAGGTHRVRGLGRAQPRVALAVRAAVRHVDRVADGLAVRRVRRARRRADEHLHRDQAHQGRRGDRQARAGRLCGRGQERAAHRGAADRRRSANIGLAVLIGAGLIVLGLPAAGSISLALAIAGSRARLHRRGGGVRAGGRDRPGRAGTRARRDRRHLPAAGHRRFLRSSRPALADLAVADRLGRADQVVRRDPLVGARAARRARHHRRRGGRLAGRAEGLRRGHAAAAAWPGAGQGIASEPVRPRRASAAGQPGRVGDRRGDLAGSSSDRPRRASAGCSAAASSGTSCCTSAGRQP